jgi:hypothetical protein
VEAEEDVEREREVEGSEGVVHETETDTAGGGEKGPWGREAEATAVAAVVASSMAAAPSGGVEWSEAALACVGVWGRRRGKGIRSWKISRSLHWSLVSLPVFES